MAVSNRLCAQCVGRPAFHIVNRPGRKHPVHLCSRCLVLTCGSTKGLFDAPAFEKLIWAIRAAGGIPPGYRGSFWDCYGGPAGERGRWVPRKPLLEEIERRL